MGEVGVLLGGSVLVHTTSNRGFTPEEIADRAVDKIVYVGSQSHPVIRDQAEAFKAQIRQVIVLYMKEAVQSERTTMANKLREAGHPELVSIINQE